jgi:hypothetical protein
MLTGRGRALLGLTRLPAQDSAPRSFFLLGQLGNFISGKKIAPVVWLAQ